MPIFTPAPNFEESALRMFATSAPGLGPLLAKQLSTMNSVKTAWLGNDGRADIVSLTAVPCAVTRLDSPARIADDLFVQIGHARPRRGDQAGWLAQRLCRNGQLAAASQRVRGGITHATFRVVVRVLSERSFSRTDLRRHAEAAVLRLRPSWRRGDPADNEIWISENRRGLFVAGLRATDRRHLQRCGRKAERDGALRPGIAAALVSLAGKPKGALVDPCCGSGTVLAEASAAGWQASGFDIDADAIAATRANVPQAKAAIGDARRLNLPDGEVTAWVSNLPFGDKHRLPADAAT